MSPECPETLSEALPLGIIPRELSKQTPGTWKTETLCACPGSPSQRHLDAYLCDRVGFMELMELRGGCIGSFPGGSFWRLF